MGAIYTRAELHTLKSLLSSEFKSPQECTYPLKVRNPNARALIKKVFAQDRKTLVNQLPKDNRECMKQIAQDVMHRQKGILVCYLCLAGSSLLGCMALIFKQNSIQGFFAFSFIVAFVVMNILKRSIENKLRYYLCLHLLMSCENTEDKER